MRHLRLYTVLGTVLTLAATGAGTAGTASATDPDAAIPAVRCSDRVSSVPLSDWRHRFSTGEQNGVRDAIGSVDTKWTVVSPTSGPAYSINPNPAWVTNPAVNWISADRPTSPGGGPIEADVSVGVEVDVTDQVAPVGDTGPVPTTLQQRIDAALYPISAPTTARYRTTFTLSSVHVYPSLVFSYAADNGVSFYLNGQAVGGFNPPTAQANAFNQWHSLVWTGAGFRSGTNVLEAVVTDFGVANGLVVNGGARACLAKVEPGTCVRRTDTGFYTYSPRPFDLGTGEQNHVPDPYTTPDSKWDMASGADAFSVAPVSSWTAGSATSNWINDHTTSRSGSFPPPSTTRTFQTPFTIGSGGTNSLLSLRYASDNEVLFRIDGVPIGGYSAGQVAAAFNQLHTLTYAGPLLAPGQHVLSAEVTDFGGHRGLLVEGGVATCYERIAVPVDPRDVIG